MKVLVIGSGAREHAIGYKLSLSSNVKELFFAPGNPGTKVLGTNVQIPANDIESLLVFAKTNNIDLTVVGPEDPLCLGIVDLFEESGLKIFGPSKEAANLEGSKAFAKEFMDRHNIPTAKYSKETTYEATVAVAKKMLDESTVNKVVLKADGLCQGKGVVIAERYVDIEKFAKEVFIDMVFGPCDMVIEEFLEGFEVSLLCFIDNKTIKAMPTVRDHKKAFEGEKGPNTGGMGTYSPNTQADVYIEEMMNEIANPFLEGIKAEGLDFRGVIFFGIMITQDGTKVLEFNTRFGDPETQSIMLRMESDILEVFQKVIEEKLGEIELVFNEKKVISTVMASKGYPKSYDKGIAITGVDECDCVIFQAGTTEDEGGLKTNGGRVLTVSHAANSFEEAYSCVYKNVNKINFDGKQFRKDISPLVNRVYVKKKDAFDVEAKPLLSEIKEKLNIKLDGLKIYQRYDLENLTTDELLEISSTILSESPVDDIYMFEDALLLQKNMINPLVIQYHKGQFDQREQGVLDAITVALEKENIHARSSKVIEIIGDLSKKELLEIEKYLINPVDQEKGKLLEIPTTLSEEFVAQISENYYDGFISLDKVELEDFLNKSGLAMSLEDLEVVQEYFVSENRNPSETEIAMIDTYWSDHCRHTTFFTTLSDVRFENSENFLDKTIKSAFEDYIACRAEIGRTKDITLMDLGTIIQRYMKAKGLLDDIEISNEINACSVKIKVRVADRVEDYLLMFKNETHNHPTEIEPFGGASTCLGGAIRDPLSGRSYVYQAMRVTGSADPREDIKDTLEGKLPQRQITLSAAKGYSSYGNQIGLATGLVDEVYHQDFKAKRMEVGAVIAAAPMENVRREEPIEGDVVILIGGRTGRDGVGGATGSSKEHTEDSIEVSSAEVQKGNAPMERKLQRLFRNPDVAKMIKKCNDFGAGGVSVAIGELADSLEIRLEEIPLKYKGLTPKEIAISESQERMAVVIEKENIQKFFEFCYLENLEATYVADVTNTNRLIMKYKDLVIVDLCRDFLNSTGAQRSQDVVVSKSKDINFFNKNESFENLEVQLELAMKDLNIGSKKGLIERFDSSIGRNTVLLPLGGKNQITPIQSMVATIPVLNERSLTASVMSYGYNPYLSEESPFLGGYYAVVESLCKVAAVGADPLKSRLSFQEYFEKLGADKQKWSKPLESLLGAFKITKELNVPPIGGKDSMSGSFKDISVPPTLISFSVVTEDVENIISPELKGGNKLGIIKTKVESDYTLNLESLLETLDLVRKEILNGNIISAYAVNHKGVLPLLMEMSFGNDIGFEIKLDEKELFTANYGSFIVEYKNECNNIICIGSSNVDEVWDVNGVILNYEKLKDLYLNILSDVFVQEKVEFAKEVEMNIAEKTFKSTKPVEIPKVIIPVFPGSNCEYDSKLAFDLAGGEAEIFIFNNLTVEDIKKSVEILADKIRKSQILFIPGGFSLSDEPDGSGKFIATVLRNPKIKSAIEYLLEENDGLILGVCNGFQALIKTGLLPFGKIQEVKEEHPTLTYNEVGRHIARVVDTVLVGNNSPWLSKLSPDATYKVPISHGEGRIVCSEDSYKELLENNQIAFKYLDNPNGSAYGIEGIVSPCGKILGKMAHTERLDDRLYKNMPDMVSQDIFTAGVEYFKK